MADNRKYYYLKLKENFFDSDSIVLLEDMKDGILYSNILLKLYLKSLKNGGKLQLDENIPYTAQMIATITRQQVGTVERALKIFMKLGLVEPLPSGALYMSNIELLIGPSSTEGERKRKARLALQEQKALPQTGADKCPPYRADICPCLLYTSCGRRLRRKRQRKENGCWTLLRNLRILTRFCVAKWIPSPMRSFFLFWAGCSWRLFPLCCRKNTSLKQW